MGALYGGYKQYPLVATTTTTGGAVLSAANPEGQVLIIKDLILHIVAGSTGAASVDAGIGADAATTYDTLIDGCSVATAGAFDNVTDKGSNGKSRQLWPAASFLTITASATLAGMTGYAYVKYARTAVEA